MSSTPWLASYVSSLSFALLALCPALALLAIIAGILLIFMAKITHGAKPVNRPPARTHTSRATALNRISSNASWPSTRVCRNPRVPAESRCCRALQHCPTVRHTNVDGPSRAADWIQKRHASTTDRITQQHRQSIDLERQSRTARMLVRPVRNRARRVRFYVC